MSGYEMHEHIFVAGLRKKSGYGKDGKWHVGGEHILHSHDGGSVPHIHPDTGPSFYGYRKPKVTKKPTGEQFKYVSRSQEDNNFELVITNSALIHAEEPIGNTPVELLKFPAADRLITGSRLRCIVRDERTSGGGR